MSLNMKCFCYKWYHFKKTKSILIHKIEMFCICTLNDIMLFDKLWSQKSNRQRAKCLWCCQWKRYDMILPSVDTRTISSWFWMRKSITISEKRIRWYIKRYRVYCHQLKITSKRIAQRNSNFDVSKNAEAVCNGSWIKWEVT